EPAVLLAHRPLLQADRVDDVPVVEGRDQGQDPAGAAAFARGRFGFAAFARVSASATRPALAAAISCSNAAGPWPACAASARRSTSMPAPPRPCTTVEYVIPPARAAAPMRVIHSRRNCPLRSRRSR